MTVCVAAICDNSVVIGASDRMLTAGDIEFEPQQPKVFPLTTSIYGMYAGDAAVATEAMQLARTDIRSRVDAQPDNWWFVRDVAYLFAQ